jgi:hypothetical protein
MKNPPPAKKPKAEADEAKLRQQIREIIDGK